MGPYQVILNGRSVTEFRSDKVRALLAYLVMETGRPHRRDALARLLWSDAPDQAVGDTGPESAYFHLIRETVQFNPVADVWLDVATFTGLLAANASHHHRQVATCQECMERMGQAAELYRGDFLQSIFLDNNLAFSEWALVKRP